MHQEPAQSVDIGTGFAAALGHAVGKAMAVALAVLASAPAIASMALLFVGTRWPSLGSSIIANAIGGVVFTGLASLALLAVIIPLNNALNQYDVFYLVLLAAWPGGRNRPPRALPPNPRPCHILVGPRRGHCLRNRNPARVHIPPRAMRREITLHETNC